MPEPMDRLSLLRKRLSRLEARAVVVSTLIRRTEREIREAETMWKQNNLGTIRDVRRNRDAHEKDPDAG